MHDGYALGDAGGIAPFFGKAKVRLRLLQACHTASEDRDVYCFLGQHARLANSASEC